MIPQLNPEIHLLIAQQVKCPTPIHEGALHYADQVQSEQNDLVNLVKTCKVRSISFFQFFTDR